MDSLSKQANKNERVRLSKERKYQKKLTKAIMKGLELVYETGEVDDYNTEYVNAAMSELYYDTGETFFSNSFRMLTKKKDLIGDIASIFGRKAVEWLLNEGAEKIQSVNDTIKGKVKSELTKGFLDGLSINQMQKNLRKTMNIWSKFEATRIARTETVAAAGFGSLEGAKSTGATVRKVWLAAFDSRTRDSHKRADLKSRQDKGIPLDDDFILDSYVNDQGKTVQGDKMQSPGRGTTAAQNINCRCTVGYVRP